MKTRILALRLPTPAARDSLREFATLLLSFSSHVGVRPPDTIYIEISQSFRLFGGEGKIVERLRQFLAARGIVADIAVADDLATAGVLAHLADGSPRIVPSGENEVALRPLPLHALTFLADPFSPLPPPESHAVSQLIQTLHRLGLKTVGDFAKLPASTLSPRFGIRGVLLHRRARGDSFLPIHPFEPVETYRESFSFEPPIGQLEPVLFAAKTLFARLENRLQKKWNAVSEMTLFFETEEGKETEVKIPLLRPLRKEKPLFSVFREKSATLSFSAPLLSLVIELSLPVRDRGGQFHLFDSRVQQGEQLDELLNRLVAGIGPTFISAAALRERYRPEAAWEKIPFEPFASPPLSVGPPIDRPTILVSPPEPLTKIPHAKKTIFRSPRAEYDVVSLKGPERLAGEWWDGRSHARDYFRAETRQGEQLWIFKSLKARTPGYFLHGYFD